MVYEFAGFFAAMMAFMILALFAWIVLMIWAWNRKSRRENRITAKKSFIGSRYNNYKQIVCLCAGLVVVRR